MKFSESKAHDNEDPVNYIKELGIILQAMEMLLRDLK